MKTRVIAAFCSLSLLAAQPAAAHHSFAMFDHQKVVTISGVVKDYQWTNPHVWIQLEVPAADGTQEVWNVETASVAVLSRRGWDRNTVKPGDKVTITLNPLKDNGGGAKGGSLLTIKLPSGKSLTVVFA